MWELSNFGDVLSNRQSRAIACVWLGIAKSNHLFVTCVHTFPLINLPFSPLRSNIVSCWIWAVGLSAHPWEWYVSVVVRRGGKSQRIPVFLAGLWRFVKVRWVVRTWCPLGFPGRDKVVAYIHPKFLSALPFTASEGWAPDPISGYCSYLSCSICHARVGCRFWNLKDRKNDLRYWGLDDKMWWSPLFWGLLWRNSRVLDREVEKSRCNSIRFLLSFRVWCINVLIVSVEPFKPRICCHWDRW